ncbi:MAG: hypothetical protein US60_C0008G0048 [Microgenomates group bacterium GW2011_GWC1_37_8]|uniref:Carrier domain-containing protein n=1 Tax=Candidatus Woesebacteria bacterium GW2011_GWB1_38_8 TaxID=1618570 RepID=A0A0G0L1N3_9BACT|nr:MAG: hypothetical protein US60_C0008G0048 [Microgenomates group bacterium GW2011_GWC1_37_8]KKQ85883.1 MAG: hypothetical protein UT08_C0003G0046 [Candidatus Woesebacteria bacterium GW2011_GWB1_38_8]
MKDINANQIKSVLAKHLGIETQDINLDDSLVDELHMKPSDLTDFLESLEIQGVDTSKIDFTQIDTVEELIDALTEGIYPQTS